MRGAAINDDAVSFWFSMATSSFLVGAATGGVLFGWLGDRLGRVCAMTISILTYSLCSGMAGFAEAPWHVVVIRFFAALGMGGEWSLGVALVMEVWGGRSRALLAGVIGAAANFGYLLVAVISLGLGSMPLGIVVDGDAAGVGGMAAAHGLRSVAGAADVLHSPVGSGVETLAEGERSAEPRLRGPAATCWPCWLASACAWRCWRSGCGSNSGRFAFRQCWRRWSFVSGCFLYPISTVT